jgi:CRP-like cAMP-binding protein
MGFNDSRPFSRSVRPRLARRNVDLRRSKSEHPHAEPVTRNRLLESLPADALSAIERQMVRVLFEPGAIIQQPDKIGDSIYFPADGVASLQIVMKSGRVVDTALVGRDGAIGLSANFGRSRCVVRSTMPAFRIAGPAFRKAAADNKDIQAIGIRCTAYLLIRTQVSAVRYACKTATQRLAACLLDVSNMLECDQIAMKHVALGEMLAVRRTSVTEIAAAMRSQKIIDYSRGRIEILDRARLSALADESLPLGA